MNQMPILGYMPRTPLPSQTSPERGSQRCTAAKSQPRRPSRAAADNAEQVAQAPEPERDVKEEAHEVPVEGRHV